MTEILSFPSTLETSANDDLDGLDGLDEWDDDFDFLLPQTTAPTLGELLSSEQQQLELSQSTLSSDQLESEASLPAPEIPSALSWANEAGEKLSQSLQEVTAGNLALLGSTLQSVFSSIAGACGPLCLHSIQGLANMASAGPGSSLSLTGGLGQFNLDANGQFHVSGSLADLAKQTGFSASDIASGKYTSSELIDALIRAFYHSFFPGELFLNVLLNGLIPGMSQEAA